MIRSIVFNLVFLLIPVLVRVFVANREETNQIEEFLFMSKNPVLNAKLGRVFGVKIEIGEEVFHEFQHYSIRELVNVLLFKIQTVFFDIK